MGDEETEAGDDRDDPDGGDVFRAEAKMFTTLRSDGYLLLKESHRKGKREICLSMEQASWVCDVLDGKSKSVGISKRKESLRYHRAVVSVIEGSNDWGTFILIQVKVGSAEPNFVILPAGPSRQQWKGFSRWLSRSILTEICLVRRDQGEGDSQQLMPLSSNQACSYAEVVMRGQGASSSTVEANNLQRQYYILLTKMD